MASRIASLWDFNGPAFTISAEEHSVSKALETAQVLLGNGNVEAVVVSAVDLAGSPENLLIRQKFAEGISANETNLSFDYFPGEGAGTVVLTTLDNAVSDNKPIWSIIENILHHNHSPEFSFDCLDPENSKSDPPPTLLELGFSEVPPEFPEHHTESINAQDSITISSSQAQLGHAGAASGMLSLIKTALCLHQRMLPAWSHNGKETKKVEIPQLFSMPAFSMPWLRNEKDPLRKAAIVLKSDKGHSEWILSENESSLRFDHHTQKGSHCFVPLCGNNAEDFKLRLQQLEEDQNLVEQPQRFQFKAFQEFQNTNAEFSMVLLADHPRKLQEEIRQAQKAISSCFENGKDWQTPSGSYFTTEPLGEAGIAFVYPGGFNSYVGSGSSLFEMDPELHQRIRTFSSNIKTLLHPEFIFPQTNRIQSEEELKELQQKFYDSPNPMFESGISSAVLATQVMREAFGIEPKAAFGYSMGEVSMLFSLGVWGSMDPMSKVLNASPLFLERIAGPMNSVREHWKLKDDEYQNEALWSWHTLRVEPEKVEKALNQRDRVYLVLINTPKEVVIAGEPRTCQSLIDELQCESHQIPVTDVVHCAPVQSEYEEIKKVHTNLVVDRPDIDFYSAANYTTTELDSEILADNIARYYGRTVDFSKLVEEVYRSGARIFIDMGPRSSCARWISENLENRRHLSLGVNRRGMDDRQMILRTLASLVSHRVPVKLESLFPKPEEAPARQLMQTITLGGEPIQSVQNKFEKDYFSTDKKSDGQPSEVSLDPPADAELPSPSVLYEPVVMNQTMELGTGNISSFFPHGLNHQLDSTHSAFLSYRHQGMKHLAGMILQEMETDPGQINGGSAPPRSLQPNTESFNASSTKSIPPRVKPLGVIFDHQDLLEFAGGKISNVFGPEYREIDTFERCVRLPMDPYLLVSRVTDLNAKLGEFQPSTITTEYDIPKGAWFCTDAQIPWAVAVESGQCDLMLISYLGIDFECRGNQVYRLLDCT
ncbi:MAG: PfaB family protein, partial [SAR324 cluster bacterium]|nr:PfaB family protein [SAR324 cluster bacterium]